ncbi:MAG TPA: site-2 protease family protein, partial [Polyangia bacterium]|nr:site-2 protease family protein [Polyangia bacterium]
MLLKPDLAAVAGTRGAVLLWHGRVAEALPLLRRATDGAHAAQARDTNLCLLAIAWAAAGDVPQAQRCLTAIGRADRTEGLWSEAERLARAASESAVVLRAVRGTRSIAVTGEGLELRQPGRVRRLAGTDIRGAEIGRTARGHAQIVIRTDLGGWRLPLADADLTWARMLFARRLAAPAEATPTVASAAATASLETQERAYQERARAAAVSSPKGVLFLGSLIASAAVMLASSSSWQGLGMVLPILFVHELGHWLAMRAFGHRDAQIAFIPMLGAATLTRTPFQKRWQEVVMLLAGPVPGIIGGIVLCAVPATRHLPHMRSLALMAIGINVLNLLPLHPLDGGRILQALVTAGRPRLDLAFKTAAALLFVAGGFAWHDPLLGGLGVFGVIFWPQARRVAELERRIRQTPGFDPRLPAEQRRAYVFRALAHEPALQAKDWAGTVASLEGPLTYRPIAAWRIAAGTLVIIVFGGGLLLGTRLLFRRTLGRRSAAFSCPGRTAARPVRCGDPAALKKIAWQLP